MAGRRPNWERVRPSSPKFGPSTNLVRLILTDVLFELDHAARNRPNFRGVRPSAKLGASQICVELVQTPVKFAAEFNRFRAT